MSRSFELLQKVDQECEVERRGTGSGGSSKHWG